MEKKKKDLLLIYLNEFNLEFLIKGAKKYNCHSIKEILKFNKILTFTKDKKQDKDLDPWVQSVSINTGKSSKSHKIFKLGEALKKNHTQIWDKLSKRQGYQILVKFDSDNQHKISDLSKIVKLLKKNDVIFKRI